MEQLSGYGQWFHRVTGFAPHTWQAELGADDTCQHRLIRIPTGFGKTAGVILAWLYHCVERGDQRWPRRLVFALPMRVLVEQIARELTQWLERAGHGETVGVHILMGGVHAEPWILHPERFAILLGTQDMLLSRALNRGYGAARGRWPMDFALLNQDVLWVLDEVQLMDVGLMTSVQLAAFRRDDVGARAWFRPAVTWWMSATLQPRWLDSVDSTELVAPLGEAMVQIPESARQGGLWDVRKLTERRADVAGPGDLAALVRAHHAGGTLTLVIVNRVDTAIQVFDDVADAWSEGKGKNRRLRDGAPELRLIHSRFRGVERRDWAAEFLRRNAAMPDAGRIIVATQVVEAGVDISATLLITELAPWPCLVQRVGRAARYPGEQARVIVTGKIPASDKDALPYDAAETIAADEAWSRLAEQFGDASQRSLAALEESLARDDAALLLRLYPYEPAHVLQRSDVEALFDTTADLTGADLDISCFVRSGEERDVSVFWRALDQWPGQIPRSAIGAVARDELCSVPIGKASKWLRKVERAYVLDYVEGQWGRVDVGRLPAGAMVLVASDAGGYVAARGWTPGSKAPVIPARPVGLDEQLSARLSDSASAQDADTMSNANFKTIATHGKETAELVAEISGLLSMERFARELTLAARWHDAGKGHWVFQGAIRDEVRGDALVTRRDLAKAPREAWRVPPYPQRPGFRHELVSTLALFELLRRTNPDHPALLGPHAALLSASGVELDAVSDDERVSPADPLASELVELSADAFDLVAYLVCCHHGKVRCTWTSTPRDQQAGHSGIHGVCEDDELTGLVLVAADEQVCELPDLHLYLDSAAVGLNGRYGASWIERVGKLRDRLGPFSLALLEAVLRAADARASQLTEEDPLL